MTEVDPLSSRGLRECIAKAFSEPWAFAEAMEPIAVAWAAIDPDDRDISAIRGLLLDVAHEAGAAARVNP